MSLKNIGRIGDNYDEWVVALHHAKNLLEQAGIKYWIDMGTVLGALRNNDLILWDNDIDFSVEISEAPKVFALVPEFIKAGYQVVATDSEIYFNKPNHISVGVAFYRSTQDKMWILWLADYGKWPQLTRHIKRVRERILYREYHSGLHPWEERLYKFFPKTWLVPIRRALVQICLGSGHKAYPMVFPKTMMQEMDTIRLCGMDFPAPRPVTEYVQMIYGPNWQTPDTKWGWDQVVAIDKTFFNQKDLVDFHLLQYLDGRKNH